MPIINVGAAVARSTNSTNVDTDHDSSQYAADSARQHSLNTGVRSRHQPEAASSNAPPVRPSDVELIDGDQAVQPKSEQSGTDEESEQELDKTFFNGDGVGYAGVVCKEEDWSCRKWIFQTLEDPAFSQFSNIAAIFIVGCIFVSIIAIVIETLPSLRENDSAGKFFIGVVTAWPYSCTCLIAAMVQETFSTAIFTIEYLFKFYAIEPPPEPPPKPAEDEDAKPKPVAAAVQEEEEEVEPLTHCQARCRWMRQPMEIVDLVKASYLELDAC